MTSQHGQHGKPAAPMLHCPSAFCEFQLVMDFGCLGERWGKGGGGIVRYYKSNMTSLCGGYYHVTHPTGMSYLYYIYIYIYI